jgi:hypothetical protein
MGQWLLEYEYFSYSTETLNGDFLKNGSSDSY